MQQHLTRLVPEQTKARMKQMVLLPHRSEHDSAAEQDDSAGQDSNGAGSLEEQEEEDRLNVSTAAESSSPEAEAVAAGQAAGLSDADRELMQSMSNVHGAHIPCCVVTFTLSSDAKHWCLVEAARHISLHCITLHACIVEFCAASRFRGSLYDTQRCSL